MMINQAKLSKEQLRVLHSAIRRGEPIAFSPASLVEIAILVSGPRPALQLPLKEFFKDLRTNPALMILPVTYEVALDVQYLHSLHDPADRTIVATARVHGLTLVTSDQRIIDSNLVPVVE
jgi:PIN domain nuclease of toxin-antitoxin system